MKRTTITLALLIIALVCATISVQPANAASSVVTFGAQLANGCESGDAFFGITFSVPDANALYTIHTVATAGGLVYMDEQFTDFGSFFLGRTSWGIFDENDTGLQTGTWPIPGGVPVTITIDLAGANGFISYVCDSTSSGRPVPPGFVLRTITCTVAVFDTPNGNPIAGATIKIGQTWFVSRISIPVTSNPKYRRWTEIFVSGTTNGYIPTACVGPKPVSYGGN